VTPTRPLRLEILDRLAGRMRAITGPAAGYFRTFGPDAVTVDPRVNLLTLAGPRPFCLVAAVPDGGERRYLGANQVRDVIAYELQIIDEGDLLDGASGPQRAEEVNADVEQAIVADISLGGLVVDVKLQPPQVFVQIGAGTVIVVIPALVTTHRSYGDAHV
jgi:hypothetical protein